MHRAAVYNSLWIYLVLSFSSLTDAVTHAQASPEYSDPPQLTDEREPSVMTLLGTRKDTFGHTCSVQAVAASGELRFIACGEAGLWVVRVAAGSVTELVTQQLFDGSATGFAQRDGKLWLQITSVREHALTAPTTADAVGSFTLEEFRLPPTHRTPTPPRHARFTQLEPTESPPVSIGKVIALEAGHAIVDLGTADIPNLRNGDHLALHQTVHDDIGVRGDTAIIAAITSVGLNRCRVELGVNEHVAVGAWAERTGQELSGARFAPPRAAGVWDVGFMMRGLLVLDDLGAGAFADAHVGYHFEIPFHVEALVTPLAAATARAGVAAPVAAVVAASLDTHLFELGLGVGGQTVLSPDISLDPGSAATLALRARLGARDGGHLELLAYMALFHSNFDFSQLQIKLQVPIARRAWLRAAVSGGNIGIGHGEIGLRLLTAGNGGSGSFFLDTVVGGANVFRGCVIQDGACQRIDYAGPMVGVGGEWRL